MQNGIFHLSNARRHQANQSLYSVKELAMLDWQTCDHEADLLHMNPSFAQEFNNQQLNPDKYLNAEQRSVHVVTFDDLGRLQDISGNKLQGTFIFTELADHRIIAASANQIAHHSYLSAGLPVLSAGYLFCSSGFLLTLSNNSGHYKPHRDKLTHHIKDFFQRAQNSHLIFEDHSEKALFQAEEQQVKHFRVQSLLNDSSPQPLMDTELGEIFLLAESINLKRWAKEIDTAREAENDHDDPALDQITSEMSELTLGALDPRTCSSPYYKIQEKMSEEEHRKTQENYEQGLARLYTMRHLKSRYGRSSSLSNVTIKPN